MKRTLRIGATEEVDAGVPSRYMCAMMFSRNAEHLISVAASIIRAEL